MLQNCLEPKQTGHIDIVRLNSSPAGKILVPLLRRFPQPFPRAHHVRDDGGGRQDHAAAQLPRQAQEVEVQLEHSLHRAAAAAHQHAHGPGGARQQEHPRQQEVLQRSGLGRPGGDCGGLGCHGGGRREGVHPGGGEAAEGVTANAQARVADYQVGR